MRLLFVHGWAATGRVWSRQAGLSADHRLRPIDLPGHGAPERWDRADLGPGVQKVGSVLSDHEATLAVGWSLGAMVLFAAAAKGAPALKGLVGVGATPSFVRREGFAFGKSPAAVRRMRADLEKDPAAAFDRFYSLNFSAPEAESPDYRNWISEMKRAAGGLIREDLSRVLDALLGADLRTILASVKIPVLLIHGTDDGVCPIGAGEFLRDALPAARLVTMEAAGHAPFITRAEAFNRAVREFAREVG